MGSIQVSQNASVAAKSNVEKPQTSTQLVSKHLSTLKDIAFGKTGSAILAGAASGALVGALTPIPGGAAGGALVGGAVGLGASLSKQAHQEDKKALAFGGAVMGATAAASMGLPGVAVALTAYAFASGAAQDAGKKVAEYLTQHADKMKPQTAAQD